MSSSRESRRRWFVPLAAALAAAVAATCIALPVGRARALYLENTKLEQYATRIIAGGDGPSSESRAYLAKLNAAPFPPCSDAELVYFREILFQSEYLRDFARIKDNQVLCTAILGRLDTPAPLPSFAFHQPDGTRVFLNLPSFKVSDLPVVSLQLNGSLVVFSPSILQHLEPTRMHYSMAAFDLATHHAGHVLGDNPTVDPGILSHPAELRLGNTLYVTRCSPRFFNCITAFISVAEALQDQSSVRHRYTSFGALAGCLVGSAIVLISARQGALPTQLRRALRTGDFQVLYQPIVSLETRAIVGAEALLRWKDRDGTDIPPEAIVKFAEEHGFMTTVTSLVLKRALFDLRDVLLGSHGFCLHVNVTASDLHSPRFLPMLDRAVQRSGVRPQQLSIELTESSTVDKHQAIAVMQQLHRLGHSVFLDDFGTGYSSLSYLQDLAFDAIKIDRSFTLALGTETAPVSLLPQILSIADSLSLTVIAEGIETPFQAQYFKDAAPAILGQGWLFAPPLPADILISILASSPEHPHPLHPASLHRSTVPGQQASPA